jgi:glyoxylase-like metal-dependent hydrolase (beta-lactamase superfamily II)
MGLVTLTVNSTHFFLIECQGGRLLLDAGWGLAQFKAQLKAYKIPISEIRYVMFTHTHPDHAGLIQDIKNASGAKLIIHEKQIPFLKELQAFIDRKGGYQPIRVEKTDLISPTRQVLQSIGIKGEIVETPGHSDDHISLVLDSGEAFTGDLPLPDFARPEAYDQVCASWKALIARDARVFYPSHTGPVPVERVQSNTCF